MKLAKILSIIGFLGIFAVFSAFVLVPKSNAAVFKNSENTYTVGDTEVIKDNLYINAPAAIVNGYVLGDLYIASNTVEINGSVNGDVYIAANEVNITGNITGTVFVAAQTVDISGNISRSAMIACSNSTITGTIDEDLTFFGASLNVTGPVGDDLKAFGNIVSLKSTVGGDAILNASKATFEDEKIFGSVHNFSNEVKIPIKRPTTESVAIKQVQRLIGYVFELAGLMLLLLVVYKLMPLKVYRAMQIANTGYANWTKALAIGAAVMFILPLTFVFLTVLGLIFPNILLAIYGNVLWFSIILFVFLNVLAKVTVTFAIGDKVQRKVFKNKKSTWIGKAFGGLIFWAVLNIMLMIPFVQIFAFILELAILLIGIGFVVMDKSKMVSEAWVNKNKKSEPEKKLTKK